MQNNMRESSKAALGGIVSALSIVIMLITYVSPLLVYTAPPFAGLLLIIIVNEMNRKWAFGTYAAVSLLSLFLIADKESAVFYTFFFGYYPVIHSLLNEKIHFKVVRIIIKFVIFNVAVAGAVLVCKFLFNIDYDEFSEYSVVALAGVGILIDLLLLFYDILLNKIELLYKLKLHKRIRKLFRN